METLCGKLNKYQQKDKSEITILDMLIPGSIYKTFEKKIKNQNPYSQTYLYALTLSAETIRVYGYYLLAESLWNKFVN